MLRIQTDKIGDMAVVECEGRIEKEQTAKKMFDVATSQDGARIVVLDLSEVYDMLAATPKQVDAEHRSFYAEDDGVIHAEEDKAADSNSPRLK